MQSSSVGTRWYSTRSTLVLVAYTKNRPPKYGLTFIEAMRRYHLLGSLNALLVVTTLTAIYLSPRIGGTAAVHIHREVLAITAIAATALAINGAAKPAREAHPFGSVQPSATPATPQAIMPIAWGVLRKSRVWHFESVWVCFGITPVHLHQAQGKSLPFPGYLLQLETPQWY